jgi:hypothetical protein
MSKTIKKEPCFAVVRIDRFLADVATLQNLITVKEIVMSKETAQSEVDRLNKLNGPKDCVYFWTQTRLIKG